MVYAGLSGQSPEISSVGLMSPVGQLWYDGDWVRALSYARRHLALGCKLFLMKVFLVLWAMFNEIYHTNLNTILLNWGTYLGTSIGGRLHMMDSPVHAYLITLNSRRSCNNNEQSRHDESCGSGCVYRRGRDCCLPVKVAFHKLEQVWRLPLLAFQCNFPVIIPAKVANVMFLSAMLRASSSVFLSTPASLTPFDLLGHPTLIAAASAGIGSSLCCLILLIYFAVLLEQFSLKHPTISTTVRAVLYSPNSRNYSTCVSLLQLSSS